MNTSVAVEPKAQAPEGAVGAKFPERFGFTRKVSRLWEQGGATFFRVDYFDQADQNKIKDSHFLMVVGDSVKELSGEARESVAREV